MIISARAGDTVDSICHRTFGFTEQIVEAVYNINPGLAQAGPVLVEGTSLILPEAPFLASQALDEKINLWD